MRFFKLLYIFLIAALVQTTLFAQNELFQDEANFIKDIKSIAAPTKNSALIRNIEKFESTYWNHQLMDNINKNKVAQISAALVKKGYPYNPMGFTFLNSLGKAMESEEISGEKLQHYFETLTKTIEYQDVNTLNNFFRISNLLFAKRQLFYTINNAVKADSGRFDFDYLGFSLDSPPAVADTVPAAQTEPSLVEEQAPVENNIFNSGASFSADGPVVRFYNTNLLLQSRFDTLVIRNTTGALQFTNGQFIGDNGSIDWSSVGSDMSTATATFGSYMLNTADNSFLIENVTFANPDKLENPITGNLEYKIPPSRSIAATNHPRFTSLTNDVVLKSLSKNINYVGAFSLIGRKFSSVCVDEKPSTLVYNDGKNSFQVVSNAFIFKDSAITASPAEIAIFIGSDSILHPGVSFSYEPVGGIVKFKKERGPFKATPFRDTYHGYELYVDQLDWNLKSDSINLNINAAKRQIPAMFKSTNYFNERDFHNLLGVGTVHPLKVLSAYQKKTQAEAIYLEEVVDKMKLKKPTFTGQMNDLDRKGFVNFDPVSGRIDLLPKGRHYLEAFAGKEDYDNLYIPSLSPELPNATIKLGPDNVLLVRGVQRFFLSDSSNVFAIPDSGIVKIFQNRDIYFSGTMIAGIFLFKGKNFQIHYEDFEATLTQIDTLKFLKAKKKAKNNTSEKQFMDNNLVYSSGTLFINDPKNKSGKKVYPEYPMFDASTGAYVYFTGKEILGGAYDRRLYFKIPPFKTDSVKTVDRKNIKFQGKFHSGNLLPEFDEELKVMPDNSLGFIHKVPKEGYDIYGGKAKFFGTLKMNNLGLRGEGQIKYQSSVFYSNEFVFYQDSIVAQGAQAKIKERADSGSYAPDVDIADYEMKYVALKDSMHIININFPFQLYKKQVQLEGGLSITPKGVSGEGLLEIKNERVIAPQIEFNQRTVVARHAVLNSKLPGYDKNSLEVNNVKISFELKENKALINPEVRGVAGISFPLCSYATSIENATWDLSKKTVYMNAEDPADIRNSIFVSTNPQHDSLMFNATAAVYDINKKLLKIDGVPFIKASDSKIIPDSNKVLIIEDGQMRPFKKAKLIIDTLNGYHFLVKGKIEIESRYKFSGNAVYRYANAKGDTFSIPFAHFYTEEQVLNKKETARYTASQGLITEQDKFYIAPKVFYKGKVKLVATKKSLEFEGFVKMDVHNKELSTDWLPYNHDGTTAEFVLQLNAIDVPGKNKKPVVQNISEAGSEDTTASASDEPYMPQKLYSGFFNESGSFDLYSTLVSHRKNEDDLEIFSATGELRYDKVNNAFVVGDAKRLDGKTLAGNKYIYNDSLQALDCQGTFSLVKPEQNFVMHVSGEAREKLGKHKYTLDAMVSIKPTMPAKALEIAGKKIAESYTEQIMLRNDTLTKEGTEALMLKLAQLGGDKVAQQYQKHTEDLLDYKPLFKFLPKLTEGIAFEKINFEWSNEHKAWYSKGKLKLSNILNIDINTKVEGFAEIKRNELGDVVTILIRPHPDQWFYINYQPGRLGLLSSESDFNAAISAKSKGETGTPNVYTFVVADEAEEALFLKDFYKNYLGKQFDEIEEFQQHRKQEDAKPQNIEQEDSNPEPVEMAVPAKKKKKSKKADITADDMPVEEPPVAEPAQEVEETPKKAEKKKKVKPTEEQPQEVVEAPKPAKKKKKKNDITSDEVIEEEPTPATDDTNPEPVETPKPDKKAKKKKKPVQEGEESE